MTAIFEKLVASGIQLLPTSEIANHFLFERDGYVALVERRGEGFGGIGSAGLLSPAGFAPLVLRGDRYYFIARGFEQIASAEQVDQIRRFQSDLGRALEQTA